MATRSRLLSKMRLFSPRSKWGVLIAFAFWETVFCAVYLLLLKVAGRFEPERIVQDIFIAAALCAPFLTVTLLIILEHMKLVANFRGLSRLDTLTGLSNRRAFRSEAERRSASRARDGFAIILDIDHFKAVNDTFGHATGDACLVEVAKFLRRSVRIDNPVCRYGGEEFAIVMHDVPLEHICAVAQRVSEGRVFQVEDMRIEITFSIGIARWPIADNLEEALRRADLALYAAKRAGRRRHIVWSRDLDQDQSPAINLAA